MQENKPEGESPLIQPEPAKIFYKNPVFIIFGLIVVLLVIGSFFLNKKSLTKPQNHNINSINIIATSSSLAINKEKSFNFFGSNTFFYLPFDARVHRGDSGEDFVSFSDSTYEIDNAYDGVRGCDSKFQNEVFSCTYERDGTWKNVGSLELVKNSSGVFALKFVGLVNKSYTFDVLLYKTKPDEVFTNEEINIWKEIISNYSVLSEEESFKGNRESVGKCMSNDKYFVINRLLIDSVGSDTLIRDKSPGDQTFLCEYLVGISDFELKGYGDAIYALALENNFLIMDHGTAPPPRYFTIYNLDSRKLVYGDSYSDINIKDNLVDYWTEIPEKVNQQNCPNFLDRIDGLDLVAIESHVVLDLSTMVKKDLGEHRCAMRQ